MFYFCLTVLKASYGYHIKTDIGWRIWNSKPGLSSCCLSGSMCSNPLPYSFWTISEKHHFALVILSHLTWHWENKACLQAEDKKWKPVPGNQIDSLSPTYAFFERWHIAVGFSLRKLRILWFPSSCLHAPLDPVVLAEQVGGLCPATAAAGWETRNHIHSCSIWRTCLHIHRWMALRTIMPW